MNKIRFRRLFVTLALCLCVSIVSMPASSALTFNDEETINDPYNNLFDKQPYWRLYQWEDLISKDNPNPYSPPEEYDSNTTIVDTSDFIRVADSNTELVDGYGAPYVIKAMGIDMPSCASGTPYSSTCYHHNESSYKQLSAMGFNAVRFYLNIDWFLSENTKPGMEDVREWNVLEYKYTSAEDKAEKQADGIVPATQTNWYCVGLDWIRRNVEWAEKYNMKIILDMHIIDGIRGDDEEAVSNIVFADTEEGRAKREQLIKVWKTIARMLYNESTIIGYNIINEPILPLLPADNGNYLDGNTTEQEYVEIIHNTISQWNDLIDDVKNAIREEDPYHILFVERMQAILDEENGENMNHALDSQKNNYRIEDDNAVAEVHFYDPFYYSHIWRDPYNDNVDSSVYVELNRGHDKTRGIVDFKYPNNDLCVKAVNLAENPLIVATAASTVLSEEYTFINANGETVTSDDQDYESYFVFGDSVNGSQMSTGNTHSGFKHFVSSRYFFNPASADNTIGMVNLQLNNIELDGQVYFDNIVVKEYNSATSSNAKVLLSTSLDWTINIYPYSDDTQSAQYVKNSGCLPVSSSIDRFVDEDTPGYQNGALLLQSTTGNVTAEPEMYRFIPKRGKYYTIECDVKYIGNNPNTNIKPMLCFFGADEVYGFNSDFLRSCFTDYIEKTGTRYVVDEKNNWTRPGDLQVNPIFMGEVGIGNVNFIDNIDDLGGERWAKDIMELFIEFAETNNPIGFSYHFYNDHGFGLYSCKNGETIVPEMYNKRLGDIFVKYLKRINNNVVLKVESVKAVANGIISDSGYNFIQNGTAMVPLRYITESLGDTVAWDSNTNQTIVTNRITGEYITLQLNNTSVSKYKADGTLIDTASLPQAPMQLSGNTTTFIPLRAVMEIMGYTVEFKTLSNSNCNDSSQYGQYICVSTRNTAFPENEVDGLIAQFNGLISRTVQ